MNNQSPSICQRLRQGVIIIGHGPGQGEMVDVVTANQAMRKAAERIERLEAALRSIHAARLRKSKDHGYGWNITALNKAMNDALVLIGEPVPEPLNLSADEIEALRKLAALSASNEGEE